MKLKSRIAFAGVGVALVFVFAWVCAFWSHVYHLPTLHRPLPAIDVQSLLINARYVASTQKEKYHLTTCDYVPQITKDNRQPFNSIEEAEAAGYEPCSRCLPRQIARAK